MRASRRCVLLFSRPPAGEERAKRLRGGAALFELARRRVTEAVAGLPVVDLLVAGPRVWGAARSDARKGFLPQRGVDFGERLSNAFEDARALGYREIVAVPGDVPQLTAGHLTVAFEALRRGRVVLGPSPDGGVWLIGLCPRGDERPGRFEGIPWCTPAVFEALRRRSPHAVVLETLPDVDRRNDLFRLRPAAGDAELTSVIGALLAARDLPATFEPARRESRVLLRKSAARAPPALLSAF